MSVGRWQKENILPQYSEIAPKCEQKKDQQKFLFLLLLFQRISLQWILIALEEERGRCKYPVQHRIIIYYPCNQLPSKYIYGGVRIPCT